MKNTSALPKYIQISEMLIREVAAGHFTDGAKLPPEREMASDLGISVGTLRKALADMQEKGLLERLHGSGNYIRAQSDVLSVYAFFRLEKITGGGLPTAQVVSVDRLPKPSNFPEFGTSPEAHRIRRLRSLDGDQIALEEIWLDGGYRDRITAQDLLESLYVFYREQLDLVITSVEDKISCATVPQWSPVDFHLCPEAHVGYIQRLSSAGTAGVVEFSRTWFDSTRAQYVARMGKG